MKFEYFKIDKTNIECALSLLRSAKEAFYTVRSIDNGSHQHPYYELLELIARIEKAIKAEMPTTDSCGLVIINGVKYKLVKED